jgi:hypothetical protein
MRREIGLSRPGALDQNAVMGKSWMLHLLALLVVVWLPSCAWHPEVGSEHDPAVRFDDWETWAWAPDESRPGTPSSLYRRYGARIREAIETELAERGYREVPREEADFLVAFHVIRQEGEDFELWRSSSGPRSGHRARAARPMQQREYRYDVGTLILGALLPEDGSVAWHGWAEAEIHSSVHRDERSRRIGVAVSDVLDTFPPR